MLEHVNHEVAYLFIKNVLLWRINFVAEVWALYLPKIAMYLLLFANIYCAKQGRPSPKIYAWFCLSLLYIVNKLS